MLQIRCKNNGITKSFSEGTSLVEVYQAYADELHMAYPVVSAKVNNASQGLKFRLFNNRDVEFIDASDVALGVVSMCARSALCFTRQ